MKSLSDLPINIIESFPPKPFGDGERIALDIEGFQMDKERLHRPTGIFASLAITPNAHDVYVITDVNDLPKLEPYLFTNKPHFIFHNAPFDVFHLRRWMDFPAQYPNFHDTMLFERVLYNGMFDRVGLKHLVRRHLDLHMSKESRENFSTATELTNEMIRYNGYDAMATWLVAQEQKAKAKKDDQRVWKEVDLPAMWVFMDFKGPKIDVERWATIAEDNTTTANDAFTTFPFNPRSPAQVVKYLNEVEHLGVESSGSKVLEVHKKNPTVEKLLAYRKVEKKRSAYGYNWIEQFVEEDGRVYPAYNVNKAITGRTSTDKPSIQNMPIRETPVFRECFIADEGNVLVGGDYSAQEPRITAFLSRDENLIALFEQGGDIYSNVASFVLKREIAKTDPERERFKSIVLGLIYHMSKYGLARSLKCTVEEAEKEMKAFFDAFPGVYMYVKAAEKVKDYVKTISGRRAWLNPYNISASNNAANSPIQGTAADMLKLALVLLWERWDRAREPFPAILEVHDEIVLEVQVENTDYAKELLNRCMTDASDKLIPGVPAVIGVKVGKNWKEIH